MERQKTIEKFILDNKLVFAGAKSQVNGAATILGGFADHLGVSDASVILKAIKAVKPKIDPIVYKAEVIRVFDFAYKFNYGNYWKKEEAKKMYNF